MQTEIKVIKTSDIQRILDVSETTAWRRMVELRCVYGKKRHQIITFNEFFEYYGISCKQ